MLHFKLKENIVNNNNLDENTKKIKITVKPTSLLKNPLIWNDNVLNYSRYSFSEIGLRNKHTGHILTGYTPTDTKYPYKIIHLVNDDNESQTVRFHRLLALAFIPNPDPINNILVDHIYRNVHNNSISNLRWMTAKENSLNCTEHQRGKAIKQLNEHGKIIDIFSSMYDVVTFLDISMTTLRLIIKNHRFYKGSYWDYAYAIYKKYDIEHRPIKNYEEIYEITRQGDIWSLVFKCYLSIQKNKSYDTIILVNDGISKHHYIHVLIANTFLDKPSNDLVVNHKDLNKKNNNILNLEWITQQQNAQHAVDSYATKQYRVSQFSHDGKYFIKNYNSIEEIGIEYIKKACDNRHRTAGGFMWRYTESFTDESYKLTGIGALTAVQGLVAQYDIFGILIDIYNSCMEAERSTTISYPYISKACNTLKLCEGYYFRSIEPNYEIDITHDISHYAYITDVSGYISVYNKTGKYFTKYKNIIEANHETSIPITQITHACNTFTPINGYHWRYIYNYKKYFNGLHKPIDLISKPFIAKFDKNYNFICEYNRCYSSAKFSACIKRETILNACHTLKLIKGCYYRLVKNIEHIDYKQYGIKPISN